MHGWLIPNHSGYFEELVTGDGGSQRHREPRAREEKKIRKVQVRRDPQVAANWLSNNLFGLLKDRLGSGDGGGQQQQEHDQGTGAPQGEGELER